MLSQEFFNSFITIYRPYLKLAEPILEKHNIYYGQWLILRDIAKHQPTTLIEISHRRAIEKPTARKTLKALIENDLITVENSLEDKRQKFLTLTPKGHELYEIVCLGTKAPTSSSCQNKHFARSNARNHKCDESNS